MNGNGKPGYLVRATLARGAASRSGIEVGDLVTSVAGKPVNAKGALGRILLGFKKGAKVSVHVTKPDGRRVVKRVTLGGKKGGRGTLGIISGKKAARNYNVKRETNDAAKATRAAAKAAAPAPKKAGFFSRKKKVDVVKTDACKKAPVGSFRRKADDEAELAMAALEDRKAADEYISARALRRKLEDAGRNNMKASQEAVGNYLDALSREANAADEVAPVKGLSTFAKLVIALGSVGSLSAIAYGVYYTMAVI